VNSTPKPSKSSATLKQRVGQEAAELFGFDGRLTWFGRLRDLVALHLSDLGGEDAASEAEKSIIRRAATLTVELERLDLKFAKAGEASKDDLDLYSRVAANLRRLLESVGLRRRVLDVTPQNIRERLLKQKDVTDVG
jgi:hypothetical protein